MKTRTKALLLTLCAVLLVTASVMGTMAYLTSSDSVENTFTVGQVKINLNETDVTKNDGTRTETGNSYKLMPGHKYTKDPMVTVLKGSEESYVKMVVTVSKSAELDKIFKDHTDFSLTDVVLGYDASNWTYKGNTEDTTANTRTYEFWYKETVAAPDADVALDALFDEIKVPDGLTNDEIKTISDMKITVKAYAIQKDGFDTAELAWAAYPAE